MDNMAVGPNLEPWSMERGQPGCSGFDPQPYGSINRVSSKNSETSFDVLQGPPRAPKRRCATPRARARSE